MKVCGFTFVRNAIKYDYPIVESISSILPICDELIVCLGNSEDTTLDLIKSVGDKKIKIIPSKWNDNLRNGGLVLAEETNKALDSVSIDCDWAFYIQADEVVHEKYLDEIHSTMVKYKDFRKVEGLLFKYLHFYGNYKYIGDSRKWYRHEIRIIRNDKHVRSFRDAQGFRKNGQLLKVKPVKAEIYHYGWVKHPFKQNEKQKNFHRYWHPDETVEKMVKEADKYDYSNIDSLKLFTESHPAVMKNRISLLDWDFEFDISRKHFSFKDKLLNFIEQNTGKRLFEYKNYRVI
jgi:glycosyltransferase involved in cell wall biosynthesis